MSEENKGSNDSSQENPREKLNKLLGFDATKNQVGGASMLDEVYNEIKNERYEANKKKATELIRKAIGISEKMEAAEKQFVSEKNKAEKELKKLIGSIEQLGSDK